MRRMLKLGAFLPAPGHHVAAWRHPTARPDGGLDFRYYAGLAQTAERGKFDLLFISDSMWMDPGDHPSFLCRFEPTTLITALAMCTSHVGLGATVSTSFNEPDAEIPPAAASALSVSASAVALEPPTAVASAPVTPS